MSEVKQWITVNGQHVPIMDGQSKDEAVRAWTEKRVREDDATKEKQIAKNKSQADKLNGKNIELKQGTVVNSGLRGQVQRIQDAYKNKSLSKEQKTEIIRDFKHYLVANTQVYERSAPSGSHILNVTGNRVWYQNKSGTVFMLAPNGTWMKFNNDLSVTIDGKIDNATRERVKALADKLHSK